MVSPSVWRNFLLMIECLKEKREALWLCRGPPGASCLISAEWWDEG